MNEEKIESIIEKSYEIWFKMNSFYDEWAKDKGLSSNELMVLYLLNNKSNEITPKYISRKLSLPKQTVTSVLNSMQKNELIVRVTNQSNKREKFILLTEKGTDLSTYILRELYKIEFEAYSKLTNDEKREFLNINHKIINSLFKLDSKTGGIK